LKRERMNRTPYPHLFTPFALAGSTLRNRAAFPAITTRMAQRSAVTDRLIQFCVARARGGAAMIVTEPLGMARHQTAALRVRAFDDEEADGLARWAEAVESEDCRLLGQIQDSGRGRHTPGRDHATIGASALPDDISGSVPRALSMSEIRQMIDDLAASSARLKRCGFSGVEISAGHGHLFHQFMSPLSNMRTDAYGGDLDGRLRFVTELISAVRATCGRGFILGVRMPGDDGVPGGIGPDAAAEIARRLAALRQLDYLCFVQGSHHRSLDMHIPDGHAAAMTYLALVRNIRQSIPSMPVMAAGRIDTPDNAERIVAQGDAELVGLGRPLLADPDWAAKAAAGRGQEVRYCVAGNACWGHNVTKGVLACVNNPRLAAGDELKALLPAGRRKRVVVVGAGIAGLEAATVAAQRGHDVTVLGRSREAGGKTRLHAQLPGSERLQLIFQRQTVEGLEAGVRFTLGVGASAADVLALQPDEVVLATGARMIRPACLPAALRVRDLRETVSRVLEDPRRQAGVAVIYDTDGSEGTYSAVELLETLYDRVVLITPAESIAQETPLVTRQGILRRIHRKRVDVATLSEPVLTEAFASTREMSYQHVYSDRRSTVIDVALLTYATPRAPDQAIAEALRAAGLPVHLVGDCRAARDSLAATADGYAIGSMI
jgi:dimethylglycine catabolism A